MVDSPYKSSVFYRIPPSMFVGIGGTVGGKAPPIPGDIDARSPLYRLCRDATHLVEYSRTFWDTPWGRHPPSIIKGLVPGVGLKTPMIIMIIINVYRGNQSPTFPLRTSLIHGVYIGVYGVITPLRLGNIS